VVTEPATRQAAGAGSMAGYAERLRTPWWWYPAGSVVGVLLGAEFVFVIPDWLAWLPIVLSVLLAVLVVWRLSSATVRVRAGQLLVGDRSLPVARIVEAIDLSPTELRRVVGRHGDPLAYTFIRSWVGPGVQFVLDDDPAAVGEQDNESAADPAGDSTAEPTGQPGWFPEPYWLISTRHPDRLIAAVRAARPGAEPSGQQHTVH
jgi:hypothetical protein